MEYVLIAAAALLGVFWLLVLPYFLLVGVNHRLGYHALCGLKCETSLTAASVQAHLDERFRAGLRQGMRAAAQFGPESSRSMVAENSLLPEWPSDPEDSDFSTAVKLRYSLVRVAFDVSDATDVATTALAVALGVTVKGKANAADLLAHSVQVAFEYAGFPADASPSPETDLREPV